EDADIAEDEEREADEDDTAVPVLPAARGRAGAPAHEAATDDGEEEEPVEEPDQVDVQPHVAVEDVAELVGDDALELIAVEVLEGSAGHGHGRVVDRVAGGEGIDGLFLVEDEDGGHGHAGRDRHLLDHVEEAALVRVPGAGLDSPAAEELRHMGSALPEARHTPAGASSDDARDRRGDDSEEPGLEGSAGSGPDEEVDHGIDAGDDERDRQEEEHHQRAAPAARAVLRLEEVHGHGSAPGPGPAGPQSKDTRWTSRSAGSSIVSRVPGEKANAPATRFEGKTSRAVL